ncbi:hypothetical protein TNCT_20691 [Trichonephila clavata]|uniref:Uncharacterized protein n=1 Tax=Trichonephila clavata TaxID=2740835 RepID=A0A8X6KT07_TRICU|nr:hypothetical protein TNCT_20691 [Trichonephila clavata]
MPAYTFDEKLNQTVYLKINEKEIYEKNEFGSLYYGTNNITGEIYAVDELGNEMYIESEKDCFLYAKKKWLVEYYATDWEGNEMYASKHGVCYFAKCLKTCNEYYPKNTDGDEFYFSDKFAKVGKTFEIYALTNTGKEIYPKNDMGKEIYAKNYLDEYYARGENSDQYYAKNEDGTYYFAKNEFGEDIYARNSDGSLSDQLPITRQERNFYIKDKEGNEIYNKINGKEMVVFDQNNFPHYARNKNRSERYPLDTEGTPYLADNGIHTFYAKDKDGNEFYSEAQIALDLKTSYPLLARTNAGLQYYPKIFEDEFAPLYTLNGYVVYPKNGFNHSIYPKENKNEYYIYDTRKRQFVFGTDEFNIEFYAMDENGNEIYPPDFSFIIDCYAKDKEGYIIYPRDKFNNKIYIDRTLENQTFAKGYSDITNNISLQTPTEEFYSLRIKNFLFLIIIIIILFLSTVYSI